MHMLEENLEPLRANAKRIVDGVDEELARRAADRSDDQEVEE